MKSDIPKQEPKIIHYRKYDYLNETVFKEETEDLKITHYQKKFR